MAKRTRPELLEGLSLGRWSEAQWAAVMSPTRLEIMQIFDSVKDLSAAELAHATGRRAESLYPHLDALAAAGLLEVRADEAHTGRRYAISEAGRSSPIDVETGAGMSRLAKLIEVHSRESSRRACRVAELAEADAELARDFVFLLQVGRLDEVKRARLRELFREMRKMCVGTEDSPTGHRFFLEIKCFRDLSLPEVRAIKAKRKAKRCEASRRPDVQDPPVKSRRRPASGP